MKKSTSTYTSKRARFNKYQPNELGNFICVDCGLTTRDARKFFKHNRMGCEAHNDELKLIKLAKDTIKEARKIEETEKTQEAENVQEVLEYDFDDDEFNSLVNNYLENYEDSENISVSDNVDEDNAEPMDIDEEAIIYDTSVRKNEFNMLERISLRLQKIFTEGSVTRSNQRLITGLVNEVLENVDKLRNS
ncbi:hypothetical protein G6F56_012253 [Rhizopus delemar]|nr:hypothetical protein G6F56_012253 [Rhizopus delemar]